MNVHSRARTCPASRALLVQRVREQAWSVDEAAAANGISVRTAYKWLARQRDEGAAGLQDRSSRPRRSPHGTPAETMHGKKIAVRFKDGEVLCGYTLTYTPDRDGFFVFPSDVESNNQRIYVLTAAANEIKAGPAAEQLAQRHLGDHAA